MINKRTCIVAFLRLYSVIILLLTLCAAFVPVGGGHGAASLAYIVLFGITAGPASGHVGVMTLLALLIVACYLSMFVLPMLCGIDILLPYASTIAIIGPGTLLLFAEKPFSHGLIVLTVGAGLMGLILCGIKAGVMKELPEPRE